MKLKFKMSVVKFKLFLILLALLEFSFQIYLLAEGKLLQLTHPTNGVIKDFIGFI